MQLRAQPGKQTLTEHLAGVAAPARSGHTDQPAVGAGSAACGGATLVSLFGTPVQRAQHESAGSDRAASHDEVHAAAVRGVATPASALPHGDAIQRSFGRHDISSIRAHVGDEAGASARDMGAAAYATGAHVVFAGAPDLHTAAHEAAHVVQQRAGVQLKGGVGAAGDEYERHADSVADAVVRGASAETLLDAAAPDRGAAPASGASVQRKIAYPIAGHGESLANRKQLEDALATLFPEPNARLIVRDLLPRLEKAPTVYSQWADIVSVVAPKVKYDASGTDKWKEFIDGKDHDAALDGKGPLYEHPGERYDFRFMEGSQIGGKTENFAAFKDADEFTSDHLGERLDANSYLHMHLLAAQDLGTTQKGWRTGESSWSMPGKADEQTTKKLEAKGLKPEFLEQDGKTKVIGEPPERDMAILVQGVLDAYYKADQVAQSDLERFMAIIDLYQTLEALHPFKDATSRTNHLVLNKLLAEHGLNPAILDEPNSPVHTREEWARVVLRGCRRGQEIAMSQTPNDALQTDRMVSAKMEQYRTTPKPKPPHKPGAPVPFQPLDPGALEAQVHDGEKKPDGEQSHDREPRQRPRQVASNGEPFMDSGVTAPLAGFDAALALLLWPNDTERHFRSRHRTSNK